MGWRDRGAGRECSLELLMPGPLIDWRRIEEVHVGTDIMRSRQFTAIIEREDDGFVALCPELDVASQGETIEEARRNLQEAVELFLETADPSEVEERLQSEVYVTHFALAVG